MYESLKRQYVVLRNIAYINIVFGVLAVVVSVGGGGFPQGVMLVAGVTFMIVGWYMKKIAHSVKETSLSVIRNEVKMMLHSSMLRKEDLPREVLEDLPPSLVSYRTFKKSQLELDVKHFGGKELGGVSHTFELMVKDLSRKELEGAKSSLESFCVMDVGVCQ